MNQKNRISPVSITSLGPQEIYVFPINTKGQHVFPYQQKAAALFGAEKGVYAGKTGACFAVPIFNAVTKQNLEDEEIEYYIKTIANVAEANPTVTYYLPEEAWGDFGLSRDGLNNFYKHLIYFPNIKLPRIAWIQLQNFFDKMYGHVCWMQTVQELMICDYQNRIAKIDFGSYCYIEQKRYGAPNEIYKYKVINRLSSNTYVPVPVAAFEHNNYLFMEDVVSCICCGVDETLVLKYRLCDIEI